MKLKWIKSGEYTYKRARRYDYIGREQSSPFLCVNSSFSYIKYVYAAFIFSNVL